MNRKKIVDVCLSAVAVSVLLAVALAFSIEMRKGASPTQAEQHYEVMKEPLQPVAVEPDKVAPVEDNKKVTQKPQRKGIFRFLRRRRK